MSGNLYKTLTWNLTIESVTSKFLVSSIICNNIRLFWTKHFETVRESIPRKIIHPQFTSLHFLHCHSRFKPVWFTPFLNLKNEKRVIHPLEKILLTSCIFAFYFNSILKKKVWCANKNCIMYILLMYMTKNAEMIIKTFLKILSWTFLMNPSPIILIKSK